MSTYKVIRVNEDYAYQCSTPAISYETIKTFTEEAAANKFKDEQKEFISEKHKHYYIMEEDNK